MNQRATSAQAGKPIYFPREGGSRIPYEVYSSPEVYQLEQERIFRGPIWSFVAMEAEIPHPNDFKSTFVGDSPVVVARDGEGLLSAWVNRCAHRVATCAVRPVVTRGASPAPTTSGAMIAAAICAGCHSETELRG